jgi:hypothetical protein
VLVVGLAEVGDGWRNGEEAISGEPHASDELVEHCGALTCLAAFVGQTARGYSLPRETERLSERKRASAGVHPARQAKREDKQPSNQTQCAGIHSIF